MTESGVRIIARIPRTSYGLGPEKSKISGKVAAKYVVGKKDEEFGCYVSRVSLQDAIKVRPPCSDFLFDVCDVQGIVGRALARGKGVVSTTQPGPPAKPAGGVSAPRWGQQAGIILVDNAVIVSGTPNIMEVLND